MGELKKLKLNNSILKDFDKFMSYHLDKIDEIEIDEVITNSKLYNIISLCTNVKQLSIGGDLRVDVNKIIFNICKPEKLETLILDSVKLPTNKVFSKFTNLKTISLNNITFSNLSAFFSKIPNPENVIALNLTNVDFCKKPFSICNCFKNLKYLNIDGLKNCMFDTFDFIYDNKNMVRLEFYHNEIPFNQISSLCKGNYTKNIEINIKTNPSCTIFNSFTIDNTGCISLTVNSEDLTEFMDSISLYKLNNLLLILNNKIEIEDYVRTFKKVKDKITVAIKDIVYLTVEETNRLREKLNVASISVFEYGSNRIEKTYPIRKYMKIRSEFEKIINSFSEINNEFEKFTKLYNYFENEIEYTSETTKLQDILIEKKCSYNMYAVMMSSCFKALGIESKVIGGSVDNEHNLLWNQVKINENWYNFDLGYEMKAKQDRQVLKYAFRNHLYNDDQFYKTHIPLSGNPEICENTIGKSDKEGKRFWRKLISKVFSIFRINNIKALPSPEEQNRQ